MYVFTCMIDFVGVAWAWSTLSELLAYPNGSRFPLGQRGSDNRGWTVPYTYPAPEVATPVFFRVSA